MAHCPTGGSNFYELHFDQLVLTAADAVLRCHFDGMDTVAALDTLQQVGLSGVGAGIDQIHTSLVDSYGGHR